MDRFTCYNHHLQYLSIPNVNSKISSIRIYLGGYDDLHSNDSEQLMDDIFIKICSIDIQIKSTFSHYLTSMSFFNPLPEFQLATKGMILPNKLLP